MITFIPYLFSLAALLMTAWFAFRREGREDRAARLAKDEARLADIEKRHALVAVEVANQYNTQHEYERERERLKGQFEGWIKQLQKDVTALEPVPGKVFNLEAKFDTLNERITNLREGLGEVRETMKDNKKEIIDAIKQIKP